MQHQVCWLFTLPSLLSCLPGEKFRINPADVERVKQISNLTQRDPTAKNVNFAWKMTIRSTVATTMDPARTSTLNDELSKKNNEIYDKLFAQLAYTLRDKTYLNRWLKEMDKGYHIFLYEIQKQERYDEFFKKFYGESIFDVVEDRSMYERSMVDMMRSLGSKAAFEDVVRGMFTDAGGKYLGPDNFTLITKPSASEEARQESKPAYHTMNLFFVKSLGEPDFHERWMVAYNKGYDNFLKELEVLGPHHFINKDTNDQNFQGGKGGLFWDGIIKYLKRIGEKGFQQMLNKIETLPKALSSKDVVEKRLLDIDY